MTGFDGWDWPAADAERMTEAMFDENARLRILSAILLMASFAATILFGVLFASHAAPAWRWAAAFTATALDIAYWETDRRIDAIAGRRW